MKFRFHPGSRFKAPVPPVQEEIEQHLPRLNALLLANKQVNTMTVAEWMATEREIEMELQWFSIHRLKLTSTSPVAVQSVDAIGLKSQPSLAQSLGR